MKKPFFFKKVKQIHFVGIKGVGMTALACCAQDLGIKISGSDVEETFVTDKILKERKISWQIGFNEKNLFSNPDLVITTGAHGGLANPEVIAAGERKIPVLTHAQALEKFMEGKDGIAVCGVGGKTTTSSMIATLLDFAGRKPSYAIGVGEIKPLGAPGRYADGKEFVTEADEYANSIGVDNRPRFSFLEPKIIVVTNIEFDHPDFYRNLKHTQATFKKFFEKIPQGGTLIACADNANTLEIITSFSNHLQTYGFSATADWRIEKPYFGQGQTIFNLVNKDIVIEKIRIKVPGKYNVKNATAAFLVGILLGISPRKISQGLEEFGGTKRRFEFIKEKRGIKLYDDYAHHPEEIKATLAATKLWFPQNRILAIFQPHSYSRTKALLTGFSQAFSQADVVVITDIYKTAREEDDPTISSSMLVKELGKYHQHAFYKKGEEEVIDFLKKEAIPGDIIMTIGAGDIFQWHQNILKSLKS